MLHSIFRLKIQQVEQVCLFELSWGRGQQLSATVTYPPALTALFQEWQQIYLSFYKTASMPVTSIPKLTSGSPMRGRVAESGNLIQPPVDWHARLVEAEAKLLYEFHRWLRSAELFEIRARIAQASQVMQPQQQKPQPVTLFLTCTPLSLARLPWEAWEIGTEFAASGTIRIVRTPANIRAETGSRTSQASRTKARVLAILGDDTGLNFETDREAVRSLSRIADVHFVGWQPGLPIKQLKTQIGDAIADPHGWDVLFFAGHSNETQMTGGELAIAPGISMSVSEIAPQLSIAKEHGLQFAIFNSCSGLSIAESLINLGLSQVAVMREPIHNRVAQEFLVRFLQSLATHNDVQESLLAACRFLKLEKNFTYPSAHLIPSLFCHPDSTLFQIEPSGWKQWVQQWMPNRVEAIALFSCLTLGLMPQVQDVLLEQRIWAQSVYRDLTGQVPPAAPPPIALVQIDDKSIRLSGISEPRPLDRRYLAELVTGLEALDANVIGIDYLLDRQQPNNDPILGQAVRESVADNTWFVFGALYRASGEIGVGEGTGIADKNWSLQGYINSHPDYMMLLDPGEDCRQTCPFAYLLSLVHSATQDVPLSDRPQPQLNRQTDLRSQLVDQISEHAPTSSRASDLNTLHFSPITAWARDHLNQQWLRPIIDFSIPPDRAYDRIAAWGVLNSSQATSLPDLSQRIVVIASGGYAEAGIDEKQSDNFPMPKGLGYWITRSPSVSSSDTPVNAPRDLKRLTGAESQAYMMYQFLTQRFVVPVPDVWMIGLAALLGQGTKQYLERQQRQRQWVKTRRTFYTATLASATGVYGLLGLQLYISAAILLPWMLPSAVAWVYILPVLRRKIKEKV